MEIDKEKIKSWLKSYHNLSILFVIVFAVVIRLYYFWITKGQPLWWDEAVYGSLAKNILYHTWDGTTDFIVKETVIRPPLFYLIWSLLISIGIGEAGTRFLLEFLPSIIAVFFVYLSTKELFGKKTALYSTAIFSVLWIHLFYTGRLLTSVPSLPFVFASLFFFVKSMKNQFIPRNFLVSILLLSIATLIRYPNGLFFGAYALFILITLKVKLLKKPSFWISGLAGMAPILIFFLVNLALFSNPFPAFIGNSYVKPVSGSFDFSVLNLIPTYLQTPFFVLFLLGLAITAMEIFLGYDQINKNQKVKSNILILLMMVVFLSYFIFIIRGAEDRWLFPVSLPMVALAGIGLNSLHKFIHKYHKTFAIIVVIGVLLFGAYGQITFADSIIKDRKQSFLQMRQGFEWIDENTPEGSLILGQSIAPYVAYYSQRPYTDITQDPLSITNSDANYMVVHGFRPHPDYLGSFLIENQDKWVPINALFFDAHRGNPAFIVYQKSL